MDSYCSLRGGPLLRLRGRILLQRIPRHNPRSTQGVALVLVLGMLGLLSLLAVAFISSAVQQQSISSASATSVEGDLGIPYAISLVINDLKTEVLAGSIPVSPTGTGAETVILYPATPWSAVPSRSGKTPVMPPNLLKQSAYGVPFFDSASEHSPSVYPRSSIFPASFAGSSIATDAPTLNGRSISAERWNKPALLPRKNPKLGEDLFPASSGEILIRKTNIPWTWVPPDWILIQNDGQTPSSWQRSHRWNPGNSKSVRHRFAYQLYDIGGLLDLNVAGYDPNSLSKGAAARRGSVGLADLTQIGFTPKHLSELVAWRNEATLRQPDTGPFGDRYLNFLFSGSLNQGFLRTGRFPFPSHPGKHPVTNRAFVSRSQLQEFTINLGRRASEKAALLNSLQYLTHFSRSLEQPSVHPGAWDQTLSKRVRPHIVAPAGSGDLVFDETREPPDILLGNNYRGGNDAAGGDEIINPAFLEVLATTPFARSNGGTARVGKEPLVNSRFPLGKLAWITSQGPSASLQTSHPQYNRNGDPSAIFSAFGLRWNAKEYMWIYDHGLSSGGGAGKAIRIGTLAQVQSASREADFFELLKAAIVAGSLGKAAALDHPNSPANPSTPNDAASFQQQRDRSLDLQVLQIGANLIDQYDSDSFPTLISIQNRLPNSANPDPKPVVLRGIEDLPYFYRMHLLGGPRKYFSVKGSN